MKVWKMQDAKVQLSALVKLAIESEPQFISLRGKPAVVVISQEEYDELLTHNTSIAKNKKTTQSN